MSTGAPGGQTKQLSVVATSQHTCFIILGGRDGPDGIGRFLPG